MAHGGLDAAWLLISMANIIAVGKTYLMASFGRSGQEIATEVIVITPLRNRK